MVTLFSVGQNINSYTIGKNSNMKMQVNGMENYLQGYMRLYVIYNIILVYAIWPRNLAKEDSYLTLKYISFEQCRKSWLQ